MLELDDDEFLIKIIIHNNLWIKGIQLKTNKNKELTLNS